MVWAIQRAASTNCAVTMCRLMNAQGYYPSTRSWTLVEARMIELAAGREPNVEVVSTDRTSPDHDGIPTRATGDPCEL